MAKSLLRRTILSSCAIVIVATALSASTEYGERGGWLPITRMIEAGPQQQSLKVTGTPQDCISGRETTWMVVDENTMLFHNSGQLYHTDLRKSCKRARAGEERGIAMNTGRICASTGFVMPDIDGGADTARCQVGEFTPVEIVDAGAASDKRPPS